MFPEIRFPEINLMFPEPNHGNNSVPDGTISLTRNYKGNNIQDTGTLLVYKIAS